MHKHAVTHGVPLPDIKPTDPNYNFSEDLEAQMFMWRISAHSMEAAERYLKDYIHTSHRDIPLTWLERVRDAPDPSGRRQLFPNQSQQAITPNPPQLKASPCAP